MSRYLRDALKTLGTQKPGLAWYPATRHAFANQLVLAGGSQIISPRPTWDGSTSQLSWRPIRNLDAQLDVTKENGSNEKCHNIL